MNITKRSGKTEELDLEKIHKALEWATEGIYNVSISEIELRSNLQFKNDMKTSDIHKILTKTAADLISERYPNYQYVAARLLLMEARKEVHGCFEPLSLMDVIKENYRRKYYEDILSYFDTEEVEYYDTKINHDRDFDFTYAGLRTVIDKFTITDKKTERIFETPQHIFMIVSMMLFKNEPDSKNRRRLITEYYNALSTFKISLPSPIMAGLRTPTKGYSSCCLIDAGDTKESLVAANGAAVIMTTIKAGIGLHTGSIRGAGAGVLNNTIKHTGIVPILKWYESAVKSFSQGARGGSATCYNHWWNWEIEKITTLKSNKSIDENSVRKLDYGISFNKLLWDRASADEDITLFSSEESRGLIEYLNDYEEWEAEYIRLESKRGIRKKKIKARSLIENIASEAFETGRYYPLFIDNANTGPLKDVIKMSNLCAEILLPVTPLKSLNDPDGQIALCILSNINASRVSLEEMPKMADLLVKSLNHIIDDQEYPLPAAENTTKNARYLGIGVSDWAHKLTRDKIRYDTQEALDLSEEYMEHWQYRLLEASNNLAIETGPAPWFFEKSKYSNGWLPNNGKWKFIPADAWNGLSLSIQMHGLKNLTLSAIPPAATSSDVSGSTSGLDMPRDFLVTKNSKSGPVKQLLPNFAKGSSYYTTAFSPEFDNYKYLEMVSKFQLYNDQGISTNTYWSEKDFIDNKMPLWKIIKLWKYAHSIGIRTLYYTNFDDSDRARNDSNEADDCAGGGCSV